MSELNSIHAIKMVRDIFETVYGNIGLLKFNIEKLIPTNGTATEESKKWDIICSFYETLGSTSTSLYKASVDLNNNTVNIEKMSGSISNEKEVAGEWAFKKRENVPGSE